MKSGLDEFNGIERVVNFITELNDRPKLVEPPFPYWLKIVLRVVMTTPVFVVHGFTGCQLLWKYGGKLIVENKKH